MLQVQQYNKIDLRDILWPFMCLLECVLRADLAMQVL